MKDHLKELFFAYKTYFLFLGGLFVLGSIIIIFSLFSLKTSVPTQTTTNPSPFSSYLKTTIGESAQNLEADAAFKSKRSLSPNQTQYNFSSHDQLHDAVIITNKGTVIYEKATTVAPDLSHPSLSSYEKKYGNPDEIIQGSKTYGAFETFYIYASKGFTLIGNPSTDEINQIQTYTPMSVDRYIQLYGDDINKTPSSKEAIK